MSPISTRPLLPPQNGSLSLCSLGRREQQQTTRNQPKREGDTWNPNPENTYTYPNQEKRMVSLSRASWRALARSRRPWPRRRPRSTATGGMPEPRSGSPSESADVSFLSLPLIVFQKWRFVSQTRLYRMESDRDGRGRAGVSIDYHGSLATLLGQVADWLRSASYSISSR